MNNLEYSFLDRVDSIAATEQFCRTAKENKAAAVTVAPLFVKKVKELLSGSGIQICTVIGYPFGWSAIEAKVAETILGMIDGADELDIVINLTALKNNDWQYLAKEINTLLTIIRKQQRKVCFTIEIDLLNEEELTRCCDLYGVAGIDCINISTGLETSLPSIAKVQALRRQLAEPVAVKITAKKMDDSTIRSYREAGIDRVGIFVK